MSGWYGIVWDANYYVSFKFLSCSVLTGNIAQKRIREIGIHSVVLAEN